jgi:hypothetical protein
VSLLAVSDIPAATDPAANLKRAEALVAAAICPALPGLGLLTWTAEYRARNDQRAYGLPLYGKSRLGPEVLRYWPITGLTSISQDGTPLTDCTFDSFSIRRDALSQEFLPLSILNVVFTTGWADAASMPEAVREAVLLAYQDISTRPNGISSERIGDVQTVYSSAGTSLSADVMRLIAPWRYVGV